jgi:hypothetical protein
MPPHDQLPSGYEVVVFLDVDLRLALIDGPGTVRGPDGYSGAVTGTFTTDVPFPLTIDLDALL